MTLHTSRLFVDTVKEIWYSCQGYPWKKELNYKIIVWMKMSSWITRRMNTEILTSHTWELAWLCLFGWVCDPINVVLVLDEGRTCINNSPMNVTYRWISVFLTRVEAMITIWESGKVWFCFVSSGRFFLKFSQLVRKQGFQRELASVIFSLIHFSHTLFFNPWFNQKNTFVFISWKTGNNLKMQPLY